jgi:aspartyl protease family protein
LGGAMIRLYIIALAAVAIMGLAALFMAPGGSDAPPVIAAEAHGKTGPASSGEQEALLLKRDHSGQFHLQASVNGNSVAFLVDTGADMLALTEEEAAELNLNISPDDFKPAMQTASGVGYGAAVTLDEVEVAGVTLHDVDAVVVQGLSVNLLGQSVLRKLGGVELKGDRMIIRSR